MTERMNEGIHSSPALHGALENVSANTAGMKHELALISSGCWSFLQSWRSCTWPKYISCQNETTRTSAIAIFLLMWKMIRDSWVYSWADTATAGTADNPVDLLDPEASSIYRGSSQQTVSERPGMKTRDRKLREPNQFFLCVEALTVNGIVEKAFIVIYVSFKDRAVSCAKAQATVDSQNFTRTKKCFLFNLFFFHYLR